MSRRLNDDARWARAVCLSAVREVGCWPAAGRISSRATPATARRHASAAASISSRAQAATRRLGEDNTMSDKRIASPHHRPSRLVVLGPYAAVILSFRCR